MAGTSDDGALSVRISLPGINDPSSMLHSRMLHLEVILQLLLRTTGLSVISNWYPEIKSPSARPTRRLSLCLLGPKLHCMEAQGRLTASV